MTRARGEDVTIYIPARDAARTLRAAIDSVRAQTVRPAELFVVADTRSTDATLEIARDADVAVIGQSEGRLGHGRNLAIRACDTPWLASCDADVTLEPNWLAALLDAADDDVAAVGGGTHEQLFTAGDRWRAVNMPHNWGPLAFDNPFMLVSEMMARVDALRSVGGYRAEFSDGDDSDLCRRLRDAGYTLRYEPAAVAHHHRGDSVAGVLDLRWRYSYPRQRSRLENLGGSISKLPVNRVYCLQSLSQTLHSKHADCCAVSLLLWFHHARKDLQAVLGHWPLLDQAARARCLALLDETVADCLSGAWQRILPPMHQLLPIPDNAALSPAGHTLAATSGFQHYLAAVGDATRNLLDQIPHRLLPPLLQSAERLADNARGDSRTSSASFKLPRLDLDERDRERLAAEPRRPAWNWSELQATLRTAAGTMIDRVQIVATGPDLPAERPPGETCGTNGATRRLALLPHLEASPSPRATLRDSLAAADVAAIAYQPPQVFIAAVPVLSARDLASECAAAGFKIRHFHTEAGLTHLIVERGQATTEPECACATTHNDTGRSSPCPRHPVPCNCNAVAEP